jgi:hypothetical protein
MGCLLNADAGGNRRNDRHHTRDREPIIFRFQETAINSGKGFHFGDPQQASGGEIGASVKAFNEQAG